MSVYPEKGKTPSAHQVTSGASDFRQDGQRSKQPVKTVCVEILQPGEIIRLKKHFRN